MDHSTQDTGDELSVRIVMRHVCVRVRGGGPQRRRRTVWRDVASALGDPAREPRPGHPCASGIRLGYGLREFKALLAHSSTARGIDLARPPRFSDARQPFEFPDRHQHHLPEVRKGARCNPAWRSGGAGWPRVTFLAHAPLILLGEIRQGRRTGPPP